MTITASSVVYLITLTTAGRECLFGTVSSAGELSINEFGWMVRREWLRTGFVRPELELDSYVVMPNHLHALVGVRAGLPVAAAPLPAPTIEAIATAAVRHRVAEPAVSLAPASPHRVLGAAVAGFKAMCTVQINHRRGRPGAPVWQRGFVERVIRSDAELEAARRHVAGNPERWAGRAASAGPRDHSVT